ncbi:hypothetical protein ACFV98_40970 [Streptomyces violascens]|uniref:hypothetical protein n=1 Tax=Streptomyces violascens TaxID=67381 RepID=UPI0036683D36
MPMTGVFCTAGGPGIAMVEALVASGAPRFQELGEERWSFFELATGHWPMLSCPDELAEVLRQATAGEGRRVGTGRQDADRVAAVQSAQIRSGKPLPRCVVSPLLPDTLHEHDGVTVADDVRE